MYNPALAHLERRQFIVNGKPVLILSGEVHYFRLRREEWRDRLVKAWEAGCNCVASYIPWLVHEEIEGDIDLDGRKRPEHDLGAFIDLCKEHGLWFMARPGPFVMGEIKNEGIPDWIYTNCPDAVPITWGGKKATSKNLNYLNEGFLRFAERWYKAVMPLLARRLETKGGNVIAVQLDNEIGMLQCWTEEPDFSEDALCEFTAWVQKRHPPDELRRIYPFDIADPASRDKNLRDGTFETARYFHADYTEFNRDRYALYAAKLRGFAEAEGVKGVPFVINIHGSGGGRATTFPIGISQTYKSFTQDSGFWGSSDHYLGDITRQNVQDLYFLNGFLACVNRPEQPLSSIEFEAGSGDYGETGAMRYAGSATDFKARLSVVQGNRMLNHYLLAGGVNPMLEKPKQDGNSRAGTTGGRHGFAAPINPEGELDPTYFALKDTNLTLGAVGDLLATMEEEHDAISLGFVPDYYSTDVKRNGPIMSMVSQVEGARGPLETLTRSLLSCGLSFPAVNLQAPIPAGTKAIALACASCLHSEIQQRLTDFARAGGHLLLYGRVPTEDLEGRPARVLADALGVNPDAVHQGSNDAFPSLAGVGWAAGEPEVRVWQVQPFKLARGESFLNFLQTDLSAGSVIRLGSGTVTLITAELPLHMSLWRGFLSRMGVAPGVEHDAPFGGVILSRLKGAEGRFISLINLDQEDKDLRISEGGVDLFGRRVHLPGRKAKLLPLGVAVGGLKILRSTAEITGVGVKGVAFRQGPVPGWVEIEGKSKVDGAAKLVSAKSGQAYEIGQGGGSVWIRPA